MFDQISWEQAHSRFFNEIRPFLGGYQAAHVSYLGRDDGGGNVNLIKMVVRFEPLSRLVAKPGFRCGSIVAGAVVIRDGIEQFTHDLLKGEALETAAGGMRFFALPGEDHKMAPFDERALRDATRLTTATIRGGSAVVVPQPATDWALRAHDIPYSDINDLGQDYGFGSIDPAGWPVVDFEAHTVSVIDSGSSVEGENATVKVRLAKGLETGLVKVGVRVSSQASATNRVLLVGSSMEWDDAPDNPGILVGTSHLTVPEDALLHCYASYGGASLHSYWVRDERMIPNASRLVLETFDAGLKLANEGIQTRQINKRDSKVQDKLEYSFHALLWMLGFAVCQIPRGLMSNATDILARAPGSGDFLLVECTTGPFGVDKRATLAKRAVETKASLARSWQASLRVIPVMVTSEPKEVVAGMLSDMRKEGIFGLAQEDLKYIMEQRTLFPQNADAIVREFEAALSTEPVAK